MEHSGGRGHTVKRLAELSSSERCNPCQEYPGHYLVLDASKRFVAETRDLPMAQPGYRIFWEADDEDPRIGKVWFTSFYEVNRW